MRFLLLALAAACLASCAAPQPPLFWRKTGATQDEYVRTTAQCRLTIAALPYAPVRADDGTPGGSLQRASDQMFNEAQRQDRFNDCMVVAGWHLSRE